MFSNSRALSLAVPAGQLSGWSSLNKFGHNPDVDTGSVPEDVWDGGGVWVPPTTARLHDMASSSANDAAAGTGARTVRVFGLDASGVLQQEDVTLNGTSNVATVNTYTVVHRMFVMTAGSGAANEGDITATAQTDGTVTAQISAGFNQTLMAIYQVPAATTLYVTSWYMGMNRSSGTTSGADMLLLAEPDGEVFQTKHFLGIINGGSAYIRHVFDPALKFEALTTVKVQALDVSANNTDISAGFDGYLVS